jgi:hypothetical protein
MPQFVLIGIKSQRVRFAAYLCDQIPASSFHANDHQGHVVALGSAFGEG